MYYVLIIGSSVFILFGLISYLRIYSRYKDIFITRSAGQGFMDLISHVPSSRSGPGLHIFAGIMLVSGISVLVSTIVADSAVEGSQFFSVALSLSALIIGATFSAITIWTLWQTRRIDFQQGYIVRDFHDLIRHLVEDLNELIKSYQTIYGKRAQPFHRVYLITTLPFFGALTYPNSTETTEFKQKLTTLNEFKLDESRNGVKEDKRLQFDIICGTKIAIKNFIEDFYKSGNVVPKVIESKITDFDEEIERFNKIFEDKGLEGPFHRLDIIPPVQFMIIGNKLYEFTLESGNTQTEVFNTQVVSDIRYCNAYVKNFAAYTSYKLLKPNIHRPEVQAESNVIRTESEKQTRN